MLPAGNLVDRVQNLMLLTRKHVDPSQISCFWAESRASGPESRVSGAETQVSAEHLGFVERNLVLLKQKLGFRERKPRLWERRRVNPA